jgi:EAL domain-containing protein (putative c-di-GMP-specific phosphodiesterase class I)
MLSAGAPLILFNVWLKKQGSDEVAVTAAWALGSAETRIEQTAAALRDLSARGIDTCRPGATDAMRQTVARTGPIKQVMLIGASGDVVCNDTGGPAVKQQVLTSAATAKPDIVLDVVTLPNTSDRFLRVRKVGPGGKSSLAALVPAGLLLPQTSSQESRPPGTAHVAMADGTTLADSGATPDPHEARFSEKLTSQKFPLTITVSMPRTSIAANYDGLRRIGTVVSGGIALVILLFAMLLSRRQTADAATEMAKAIEDDEFVPYYQPLVDLQNGKLLGAEVLVRWRRDDGNVIEPNSFILMLESSGLVLDFTRKLMHRVRNELGDAVGRRPGMTLAFNVAPRHFHDALILNDVGTIFDSSKIRLSQIVLELTERHEVVNLAGMRRTIAALQRVGCRVAIDDVGTGHSGLAYILKLGVDIIKIDKVFVESIGTEGHSKAIIETLIDLAKNMRMEIIAEGVETFDQVTYLRERGIGAAQGYVFAPPLPAATFLQLLDAMDPVSREAAESGKSPKAAASR